MKKRRVVVDASVIAKWFLEEQYSDRALKLRDDYVKGLFSIVAPSLLTYEVLNALKYSRVYSIGELEEIGKALNKYGFDLYELRGEYKLETIRIAMEMDITIYDASYVALARRFNTVLYTADEELEEKFPELVVHIRDYGKDCLY
ncbi:MAG: type II toxin-antitoxin system VapC family toxin [Thermoprotei archaeon]|nr:type II toxin-antitoxin system VapC family toxin [Thermoprotei archaeon]